MKKYYVEIVWDKEESMYIIQSKWYETEEKAIEWAKEIDYLDGHYTMYLMSSEFNEDGEYGDIIQEKELFL